MINLDSHSSIYLESFYFVFDPRQFLFSSLFDKQANIIVQIVSHLRPYMAVQKEISCCVLFCVPRTSTTSARSNHLGRCFLML